MRKQNETHAGIGPQRWPVKRIPVKRLVPADYNPRTISPAALEGLRKSLEKWGLVQPIVWNKRSKRVVGGHQRLKLLAAAGIAEIECVVVDLNEADEKALNIELNNPHTQGEWTADLDGLLKELSGELDPDLLNALSFDKLLQEAIHVAKRAAAPAPKPELEITPELHERHDYIVVYFENAFDWQVAVERFGLKTVTAPPAGGSTIKMKGLGRVVPGAKLLEMLK